MHNLIKFLLLLGTIIIVGAFFSKDANSLNYIDTTISEYIDMRDEIEEPERDLFWKNIVAKYDPEIVYKRLVDLSKDIKIIDQHAISHEFGYALYKKSGDEGFVVCDPNMGWGCHHEFISQVVQANGISSIGKLNELCGIDPGFLGCQHGIGHGLIGYLGYKLENLNEALDICNNLPNSGKMMGCKAGLFMEYNDTYALDIYKNIDINNELDWHAPCNLIEEEFQPACYYYQPQFWWMLMKDRGYSDEDVIGKSFSICENSDNDILEMCLIGVSYTISRMADMDVPTIKIYCDTLTNVNHSKLACRTFNSGLQKRRVSYDKGIEMCSDLSEKDKEHCLLYINTDLDIYKGATSPSDY